MSKDKAIVERYFWCDAPSPLHDSFNAINAKRQEVAKAANALAKSHGAKFAVGRRQIEGFVFAKEPDQAKWKFEGKNPEGERYYFPKKLSKDGKALAKALCALKIPSPQSILSEHKLEWMACSESYMHQSALGYRDGRIMVRIPFGGEGNSTPGPKIPAYLSEWKEWEYKRWMAEGRPVEAKESA